MSNFTILNTKGVPTFFRRYKGHLIKSVLDLTWASNGAFNSISNWHVMHNWHHGLDHYPISFDLSFSPFPVDTNTPFSHFNFHDNNRDNWVPAFLRHLHASWCWDDLLETKTNLSHVVQTFTDAMISTSREKAPRKPVRARAAWQFNQDVRWAVMIM